MNRYGRSLNGAGEIELRNAFWQILKSRNEQRRVLTTHHYYRTRLSLFPEALGYDRTVSTLVIELDGHTLRIMNLDAIY